MLQNFVVCWIIKWPDHMYVLLHTQCPAAPADHQLLKKWELRNCNLGQIAVILWLQVAEGWSLTPVIHPYYTLNNGHQPFLPVWGGVRVEKPSVWGPVGHCFQVFSTIQGKTLAKPFLSLLAIYSCPCGSVKAPSPLAKLQQFPVPQNSGSQMSMLNVKPLSALLLTQSMEGGEGGRGV